MGYIQIEDAVRACANASSIFPVYTVPTTLGVQEAHTAQGKARFIQECLSTAEVPLVRCHQEAGLLYIFTLTVCAEVSLDLLS